MQGIAAPNAPKELAAPDGLLGGGQDGLVQLVEMWSPIRGLRGLVDLAYRVRVPAAASPVLPDGRAGIVWLSDGTVWVCGPERRAWRPDRVGVEVVGVRLTLGVAPRVLGVPAYLVTDARVELRELWGLAAVKLAEQVGRAPGPRARAALLQAAVGARRGAEPGIDPVARRVVERLTVGNARVCQLAAEVGLSERQLRRRCQHAFGYSPGMLARLMRLHRFLDLARSAPSGTGLAALAIAAGYVDQSHLTRECNALTDRRPSVLMRAAARQTSDPFKTGPAAGT